jgi:hypothetical protein
MLSSLYLNLEALQWWPSWAGLNTLEKIGRLDFSLREHE